MSKDKTPQDNAENPDTSSGNRPDQGPETASEQGEANETEHPPASETGQHAPEDSDIERAEIESAKAAAETDANDPQITGHKNTSWGLWLLSLLLVILLAGAAFAGWWAWGQWEQWENERSNWEATQSDWQSERDSLASRINDIESQFSERDGAISDVQSGLDETRNDLVNLATRLNEQTTLQDSDIQRLEIEYLLRTARHVSQLTGDLTQARTLIEQADRMVAEFDDLAYMPVREALAMDIQVLRELPQPDVTGIYFELQALATRSRDWQWWPDSRPPTGSDDSGSDFPPGTWYEQLGRELRDLVSIRYRDEQTGQRLSPEAFNQMQAQFRLLTQQAQVALIQRNQTLYNASLEQAMEWLDSGVDQIPQAEAVRAQLESLRAITVETEIPTIDRGLTRLQAMIEAENDDNSNDEESGT